MAKTFEKVLNNKSYTLKVLSETCAYVYEQAVNPKTGKGWQAHRNLQTFQGEKAVAKARRAWLYAGVN